MIRLKGRSLGVETGAHVNSTMAPPPDTASTPTGATPAQVLAAMLVGAAALCWWLARPRRRRSSTVPTASGALPIVGHALAFKKDPAGFLSAQSRALGAVFRINLAGKRMVVIGSGDRAAMKSVAMASEKVLSARHAVAAVGFEQTLGLYNVHHGTDFHKRVLKGFVHGAGKLEAEIPQLHAALARALAQELRQGAVPPPPAADGGARAVADLLALVRRVVLRAVIERLLGRSFARRAGGAFVLEFMGLQDQIEDATAKAAVLPRWLSLPLVLWPVAFRRRRLGSRLARLVTAALGDADASPGDHGPWLRAFRTRGLTAGQGGELIIGLLFAAHKNPAIAAAQSYLNLMCETESASERALAAAEAASLRQTPTAATLQQCGALRRCCLETLRLTAHTIGAVRTVMSRFVVRSSHGHEHTVHPGETIAISHIASSLDPVLFGEDAASYRPGRQEWALPAAGADADTLRSNVDEYKMTTFSHGLHKCPGERVAIALIQLTVALLLQHDIELVGELPAISFERATLAQRAGPVAVRLRRRGR